jgi:hypothetical protein
MKNAHVPFTPHGKAPHDHSHKHNIEHVSAEFGGDGHDHFQNMVKAHSSGMPHFQDEVKKMCGGGMAKGKK